MYCDGREEQERRQRDGNSSNDCLLRHRIPYRLLGRRSLGAKRLVVSSKVLFPAIPTENCDVILTFPANTEDATLMWLLARFKSRAPAVTIHVRHHSHTGIYGFYITAAYENLLQGAEELGLLKPLKSEYGGGMKEFVYEDQDCFAGADVEISFLTSQERQSIVLHFLDELRATSEDSLTGINFVEGQAIVPRLISKKVISQVFPLHENKNLKLLQQSWVQAVFSPQPLDLVCRYFGVKIGLYFAYLGHYTSWLLLPALVGISVFLCQGANQEMEDACFVGFALFNVVWAALYLKFWKRASTEYCYRWGTLEKKDELLKDPRPLFKGNLVKSPVTGHLELHYPAWKRILFRHCVTVPVIGLCLALVFIVMLLCFELQEWINDLIKEEDLPYLFSFGPKVLLALVVSLFDDGYKQIAIWLTHKENYRLEESHETSLVIKMVLFQFVNSFLSLFYIAFYLNDMDRLRDQLAALLITRQVLGNVKEALMPYILWKARLYRLGYRIATQMSPASVEKEVRRMTTQQCSKSSVSHKASKSENREARRTPSSHSAKDSDSEESFVSEEDDVTVPTLTQAEVESSKAKYEDTLEDYLEMSIQFGYITLFSPAFPLAALCALLNNIIEIRSDAFKLCFTHQRPFGQRVDSIGIWQDILVIISILAIIVNCALLGTSGLLQRVYPGFSPITYCLIIVLIEHLIISVKMALSRSIPDLPRTVATEMARLEYLRSEALKQLVSQAAPNVGGMSLAPHHPGSPSGARRKRFGECSLNLSGKEASPLSDTSSPCIISPTSSPRMDSISTTTTASESSVDMHKPKVPPRSSLQSSDSASNPLSQDPFSATAKVVDKVVAAALEPVLGNGDLQPPIPELRSKPLAIGGGVEGLPPRPVVFPNETYNVRSVGRGRVSPGREMEIRRRRSEPVSDAVTQAVNALKGYGGGTLKKKSAYEHREDLTTVTDEKWRKGGDSAAIREELKHSRDKLNHMLQKASSGPQISPVLSSLPPSAPSTSSSHSSTSLRHFASPRLLRSGALADPSPLALKVLSRKSRSFSSADVTEARQAFRDRLSWRGEIVLPSRLGISGKSQLTKPVREGRGHKEDLTYSRTPSVNSTTADVKSVDDSAATTPDTHPKKQVTEVPESSTRIQDMDDKFRQVAASDATETAIDLPDKSKAVKCQSDTRLSILNRAVRTNASQPLSISSSQYQQPKAGKE